MRSAWLRSLIVFAVATVIAVASGQHGLACEKSGYCSFGQTKTFRGDISDTPGLKSALSSCSFRRELILLTSTANVLENALQVYNGFLKLGLAHTILLVDKAQTCDIAQQIFPSLCCVWAAAALPEAHFPFQLLMWHHRRRLTARAVRLGYNMMVVDSDFAVFDDPYIYLKHSMFKDVKLFTATEHFDYKTNSMLNLGFLYVQDADPSGPTAAVLAEVPDRQLRYAEDNVRNMAEQWNMTSQCGTDEQLVFDDVVYSAALGRPVFVVTSTLCTPTTGSRRQQEDYKALNAEYVRLVQGDTLFKTSTHPTPPDWRYLVGSDEITLRGCDLTWPMADGSWPTQLGGQLLPTTRGPLSLALQEQLRSECDGCAMWPDPMGSSQQGASAPKEKFLFMPDWLVGMYQARGRHGTWGQVFPLRPQQVLGHIHQTPADGFVGKGVIPQMLGMYNFELAHALKGQNVFLLPSRFFSNGLPKVVAFHPALHLSRYIRSLEDYKVILRGLVAVAQLTGRALLLPDLPCSLPWITTEAGGADSVPMRLDPHWAPHGYASDPQCTWLKFFISGCFADTVYSLASWQFEHLKDMMDAAGIVWQPSHRTTLSLMKHKNGTSMTAGQPGFGKNMQHGRQRRRRQRHRRGLQRGLLESQLVGKEHAGGGMTTPGQLQDSKPSPIFEVDAGDLFQQVLPAYNSAQVLYLRRPLVVSYQASSPGINTTQHDSYQLALKVCRAIAQVDIVNSQLLGNTVNWKRHSS